MKELIDAPLPKNEEVNILIVDDDPIVLEVMKSFIASYGFRFTTAGDGTEAVDILAKKSFNIVLSDINMPKMDGMELLRYIQLHHPQTGVILITGLSEEYTFVDVINAGAIDYMTKPFDGQELIAKLQRVIREQTLIHELEQLSICDSLTGLYNRRHFDLKINEEVHRAARQNYTLYLSFIDVDNFKSYNDTYGHQAGDNLLATIGKILSSNARKGVDWPFRYGGDEFALIITQANEDQARMVNERIVKNYDEHQFGETSLSIGCAKFVRNLDNSWGEDIKKLMALTDSVLYEAKKSGRNKILFAEDSATDQISAAD